MKTRLFAAGLLFLFASGLAEAEERPESFSAIRKRIARDRVRVRFLKKEEASILKGLQALEREIEAREKTIEELGTLIDDTKARMAQLDERILENDQELAHLKVGAGKRAAAMHRLRRTSMAALLGRVSDPIDVRRMRDRLRFVMAYDGNLIRATRAARAEDRRLRAELEQERSALAKSRDALESEKEDALLLKEERALLLEAIRSEKKTYQTLARELRSAARRLEVELSMVRGAEPAPEPVEGGFAAQRGLLPWPVAGRVEMTFGKKVDPKSGMVMVSKGIDVRAPQSAPVRSVFSGRVAFAKRFEGYGRMVIVDHSGGWFSLYAHLESFAVRAGQTVNQHQVVGFVGDSGSTKGAYLYFEVRNSAKPVDPMLWLAR